MKETTDGFSQLKEEWQSINTRIQEISDVQLEISSKQNEISSNNSHINALNKLIDSITNSWSLDSIEKGKLGVCAQKCGSEFDPFKEQFV